MPGENYGAAAMGVLGQIQNQEIAAAKAPVELQLMQAEARSNQARAGALELATQLQKSGLKSLEGFQYDPKDPIGSMLQMAGRVGATQPVLAENLTRTAGTLIQHRAQEASAAALAEERKIKTAGAKVQAMSAAYGDLPSTSPEMIGLARQIFRTQMTQAGADPNEINDAINTIEGAIKAKGPAVIKYLHDHSMSTYQSAIANLRAKDAESRAQTADEKVRHDLQIEKDAKAREARLAAKAVADAKAGRPPKPLLSIGEAMKTAAVEVSRDPLLSDGESADKLKWSREIGQAAIEKVNASYAEHLRNPNIPIKKFNDAMREALEELHTRVKQDPSALQKLAAKVGIDLGKGAVVEKQPKPGAPSLTQFLEKAMKANPQATEGQLKDYWEKTYAQ